jgi:hypothetical protein
MAFWAMTGTGTPLRCNRSIVHHFGLATACGHFGAIAGEAVVGWQMKVSDVLGVAFKQVFAGADLFYFPDIDKGLNRFSLKIEIQQG